VIGALEDAEDYQAFEATIIADYDSQSAVESELMLRLASLLWRLRRTTIMEAGLFEIQGEHLRDYRQADQLLPHSGGCVLGRLAGTTVWVGASNIEVAQYDVTEIVSRAGIAQ
jgi:hypothetical protein